MKSVNLILVTGMVIISSALLAQTKGEMTFTSSSDLAKAKLKYSPPSVKDKEEIKNIINSNSAAYLKGDVNAILKYYSDQSINLSPNQMVDAGIANIRVSLEETLSYISFNKVNRSVQLIEGAGPIAVVWAKTESAIKSRSTGEIFEVHGDDIFIFQKQKNGKWQILAHHWNENGDPNGQQSDDHSAIRQIIDKWSFSINPGEILSQKHIDNYTSNFSDQAVEILPNQRSNIGIANIRLRNSGAIGMTWAQCTGYTFDINSFATIGAKGFSKRAVAWGIGDHSNYPNGSDKLSQAIFPFAMILTKENDSQWRILVYHFYFE